MYTLALVALVALVSASFLDAPVLDDELIARINADDSIPWTAGRNSFWEGKTRREARRITIHTYFFRLPRNYFGSSS